MKNKIVKCNCCAIELIKSDLCKSFVPFCMEVTGTKCKYKISVKSAIVNISCRFQEEDDSGLRCSCVQAIKEAWHDMLKFVNEVDSHIDNKTNGFSVCRKCEKELK